MRDEATGASRGFGFVNFDSFESSDAAISAMNGEWLMNRQISVNYAFKKDGRERYGTDAGVHCSPRLLRPGVEEEGVACLRPGSVFSIPQPSRTTPLYRRCNHHIDTHFFFPSLNRSVPPL